jgi:hypothetical protein
MPCVVIAVVGCHGSGRVPKFLNPAVRKRAFRRDYPDHRRGGPRNNHLLTYDLSPNGRLVITHLVEDRSDDRVVARGAFRLAAGVADQARASLRRVRPEALTDIEDATLPSGCSFVCDASPQVNVVSIDARQRIGISSIPRENAAIPRRRETRASWFRAFWRRCREAISPPGSRTDQCPFSTRFRHRVDRRKTTHSGHSRYCGAWVK